MCIVRWSDVYLFLDLDRSQVLVISCSIVEVHFSDFRTEQTITKVATIALERMNMQ